MKREKHIPVLLLAAFFTVVSNGVPIYEHFCRTNNSISYGLIAPPTCEMEKAIPGCCEKKPGITLNKKGCCHHTAFFKKFSFDGFTASVLSLKSVDIFKFLASNITLDIHAPYLHDYFTGLSPPYPDYEIAQYLQLTQPQLQVFIC